MKNPLYPSGGLRERHQQQSNVNVELIIGVLKDDDDDERQQQQLRMKPMRTTTATKSRRNNKAAAPRPFGYTGCFLLLFLCCIMVLALTRQLGRQQLQQRPKGLVVPRIFHVDRNEKRITPLLEPAQEEEMKRLRHRYKKKSTTMEETTVKKNDTTNISNSYCEYIGNDGWQTQSHPTCNTIHEISLHGIEFIDNGHFREVYAFQEYNGDTLALKELRFRWDFDQAKLKKNRQDAIAMEHLTPSKWIPDIYANCMNAGIFYFSRQGTLEQRVSRESEHYKRYSPLEKLHIAIQVASAVADVHEAGIAHTDVAAKQFLLLPQRNGGNAYQLNDFNRLRFLKYNNTTNKTCTFYSGYSPGKGRSPEEYNYENVTEKIDVYSMGNVFYYMLAEHKYFDGVEESEAQERVMSGKRPRLSSKVRNSTDKATVALIGIMRQCQAQEPQDRPTARQAAQLLEQEYKRITAIAG